jgi:hypothetical protein
MGCSDDFRPWTTKAELHTDAERLRARVAALEAALQGLQGHSLRCCTKPEPHIHAHLWEPCGCRCGYAAAIAALQQPQDAPTGAAGRESTVEHAGAKQGGFAEGE